jgi:molybdopterin-guanine dinucleotide biosynthesis protein A
LLEAGFDRPFSDTAIILLAAGKSSRFDAGDKLMAMYRGAPIIERSARLLKDEAVAIRIAIVGEQQHARTKTLQAMGWSVAVCRTKVPALAASISEGIRCASNYPVGAALILLADMPEVSERHLLALREAITVDRAAVFSRKARSLCPRRPLGVIYLIGSRNCVEIKEHAGSLACCPERARYRSILAKRSISTRSPISKRQGSGIARGRRP